MDRSRKRTLTTLLARKERHEYSARAALVMLGQSEAALLETKASLLKERCQLWSAWRRCSSTERELNHSSLHGLRIELDDCNRRDQVIIDRIEAIDAQWHELQLDRADRAKQLRRALIDQEKLRTLLD
jgi:hypothetical protein